MQSSPVMSEKQEPAVRKRTHPSLVSFNFEQSYGTNFIDSFDVLLALNHSFTLLILI